MSSPNVLLDNIKCQMFHSNVQIYVQIIESWLAHNKDL
jgi:hypothetical protein